MMMITTREDIMAKLISSGWREEDAEKATSILDQPFSTDKVTMLVGEYKIELLERFNVLELSRGLESIMKGGICSGDYMAAAIAAATLNDLLQLVTESKLLAE